MKNFKFYFASFALVAMMFSSCSKEDENQLENDAAVATLSFGAVLNDMVENKAALKQLDSVPECSEGEPAYVQVALQDEEGNWVVGENGDEGGYIEIPVNYDEEGDIWFTEESMDLELPEGIYTLEYFGVLTQNDEVLWIAPRENDDYGPAGLQDFVDDALPISIDLRNGTKKYVDVEVICFDDRLVNEYGYLFFDIETNEIFTFCVFGNYCDENGRHFPANFRMDIWTYSGNPGEPRGNALFDENDPYINEVGTNGTGDDYADPLCVSLPNGEGEDLYYAEIYMIDFNSGNEEGELIRSGVFSDAEVMELYNDDDTNEYYHFREGDCTQGDNSDLLDVVNGDGDGTGSIEDLEPNGPDPEWGPTITDPMLVVIEEYLSYNVPPLTTLTAEQARQQPSFADAYNDVIQENNLPIPDWNVDTTGISIPVEGGQIPARIYTPNTGKSSYPVIVYYHGGGWVIAGIDTYDASARALASRTDAIVVSVGYRQAPEYKFPTAHNDAYAAYLWTLENAASFNGNGENVAVAGESAGGNLAAGVSIMARNNNEQLPVHQALIYPIANHNFDTPSYNQYQNSLFLNSKLMKWFFDYYLNSPAEGDNPLISLVDAADLHGLPSTTVISAQIGPLQSEDRQLAENLAQAGVETTYELYIGVTHEFFGMAAVVPQAVEAQILVANELREAFNN